MKKLYILINLFNLIYTDSDKEVAILGSYDGKLYIEKSEEKSLFYEKNIWLYGSPPFVWVSTLFLPSLNEISRYH